MARCNKCNKRFDVEKDREVYFDYVSQCGYERGFPDFDEDYCFSCNADNLDYCMERLNVDEDEEEEDPGVYRSYEEWQESGEPVDQADDAIWLHDQE